MLSNQVNPLKPIEPKSFYLAQLSSPAPEEDELARVRKNKAFDHLRKVQRSNFVVRAFIHVSDLFHSKAA